MRERDRNGKDVKQARVIKDRNGNALTDARSVTAGKTTLKN